MKLVDYSAEPFAPKGVSCARFTAKFDDRRASYPAPGMLIVRGSAVACGPNTPDVVVTLRYAQRGRCDDLTPEVSKVGDAFLASLRFLPSDPAVLRRRGLAVRSRSAGGIDPAADTQPSAEMARRRCSSAICICTAAALPRDFPAARKWLEIAAKDGHAEAMFNLGAIYDKALGVDRDAPQAHQMVHARRRSARPRPSSTSRCSISMATACPRTSPPPSNGCSASADNGNKRAQAHPHERASTRSSSDRERVDRRRAWLFRYPISRASR